MRECSISLKSEISDPSLRALTDILSKRSYDGFHLEIGTAAGGALCHLMEWNAKIGSVPKFIVVDPMQYFPNQFEIVCENIKSRGLPLEKVEFLRTTSAKAFGWAKENNVKFDFILIDGNHKIRYVNEDLRWTRFLHPGGLLCVHDYSPRYPGVYLNMKRFLHKYANYKILSQVETLLILEKKSASQYPEISALDRLWATCLGPWFQLKASTAKRVKKLRSL
jgi:predicted O-methyltransferase YrrM